MHYIDFRPGLGLFICKNLCHIQGGNIGFFSEENKGSTFTFFVKARHADTPKIGSPARAASWPSKVEGEAKRLADETDKKAGKRMPSMDELLADSGLGDVQTPLVLIVEDNLINQRVLQQQLTREGFTTLVANNGKEALDVIMSSKFSKEAPDDSQDIAAVLMDMEMPVMDGMTATRLIRQVESEGKATKHISIIGITANARPEQCENPSFFEFIRVIKKFTNLYFWVYY